MPGLLDLFGSNDQQPTYGGSYGGGGGFGGMSNSLIGLGMGLLTPYNAWKGESPWANALQGFSAGSVADQRRQQQQQELQLQRERMAQTKMLAEREPESIRQLRAAGIPQEKWGEYLYPKQQPELKEGKVTYREQDYPYQFNPRTGEYVWGPLGPPPNLQQQRAAPAAAPAPAPAAVPAPPATTGAAGAPAAAPSSDYPPDFDTWLPSAQKAYEAERAKKLAVETVKSPAQEQNAKVAASNVLSALDTIDKLVENKGGLFPTTGVIGSKLTGLYQPSTNLDAALQTVKANVSIEKLNDMRKASATGGALGNVTEGEHRLLQSTIAALEQSQDAAQLKANLARVRATYEWVVNRRSPNEPPPFSLVGRPGAATTEGGSPAAGSAPAVGTVSKGYRFKGGDPSQQSNWEAVR